jgi:MoaA/NifB/PqqE/SkfB family radical SAM enzyme
MDPAILETIVRETHAMGTFRVVLCGDGEPALHPEFDRMLELITQLRMEPYVITNGLAVDESRARFWATKRAHYRFSINAGDEETWLRVHPSGRPGQFERLSRVIKLLVQAGTPRISTLHVIHRANFRDVSQMVEHARELGVREILFRPVRAEGILAEVVLNAEEEAELRESLRNCLCSAETYGIRTNLQDYLANGLHIHSGVLRTAHLYQKIPCYLGWLYAEFDLDGTMRPCLHSEIEMGRAGDQRIRDIWRSAPYRDFRRQSISLPRRGEPVPGCQCTRCVMAKYNTNTYNLLHLRSLRYGAA